MKSADDRQRRRSQSPLSRRRPLALAIIALWVAAAALWTYILAQDRELPRPSADSASTDVRAPDEIHTIHAPFGIPAGAPVTNDIIFRHIYTASTNDDTKLADWVAYAVTRTWLQDLSDPDRDYRTDPFLDDDETLEERSGRGDYEGAYAQHNYDRGHLIPLGSFRGSPFTDELNFLSILAPQIARLNRGPWKSLENAVRRLVTHFGTAYVLAGPYYDDNAELMPALPGADELHRVPNGYWMIVYTGAESPKVCAFVVPQLFPDSYEKEQFISTVDAVEVLTGLDFLSRLRDVTENSVEARTGADWFASW